MHPHTNSASNRECGTPGRACRSSSRMFQVFAFQKMSATLPSPGTRPSSASTMALITMRACTIGRHPHPIGLDQQQRPEQRAAQIADAGNQPDDDVPAEADVGARNAERLIEQLAPAAQAFEVRIVHLHASLTRPPCHGASVRGCPTSVASPATGLSSAHALEGNFLPHGKPTHVVNNEAVCWPHYV